MFGKKAMLDFRMPDLCSHDIIYNKLPQRDAKELGLEIQSTKKSEAFVNAFLKRCIPSLKTLNAEEFLSRRAVVLEHYQKKRKRKSHKAKGFTAKERRELRLFKINPDQQRYNMYLPLHELWKQYIRDLCHGLRPDMQPQMIQNKLLKADLHGAMITVFKSKCPSYVGLTGILLQESKHIFKIITKEDKLKVVPKLNCVFSMEIDGFISYIYGSKLQMKASERSAKKFKAKGSIDL
ncbi:ribonuclease P protein subunit p29 isoform X2 [Hyla sarda]|uniref:ribonuclease P protein subunit p29 isoform X2 n=1 Tax=Hyla sarda TaxID=327740 RepID=UPI0024C3EFFE|nr:ribonuclease P protein subunit p29 isoform X2 [Hyla sarda]